MKAKRKSKLMQSYGGSIGNRLKCSNWNANLNKETKNGDIAIRTPQISLNRDKDYLWEDGEKVIFIFLPSA